MTLQLDNSHSVAVELTSVLILHEETNSNFKKCKTDSHRKSMDSEKDFLFCRICHENGDLAERQGSQKRQKGDRELLAAPCNCTGTSALIHISCLERWLTASNSDSCEICKFVYHINRVPRNFHEYLRDGNNQYNIRNLIADIICFMLLTPLLFVSTYLCFLGATQYFQKERVEAAGLVILSLFLVVVYITWCYVTIQYHCSVWDCWKQSNQRVRVVLKAEKGPALLSLPISVPNFLPQVQTNSEFTLDVSVIGLSYNSIEITTDN